MINKTVSDCRQAVAAITDGSSIMLGGFGNAGMPAQLIEALREHGARNLTIISNGAGTGDYALGALVGDGKVSKVVASFPAPSAEGAGKDATTLLTLPSPTRAPRA